MDLATLGQIKQYLGITDSNSDPILQALLDAYSTRVQKYCGRNFALTTYSEVRDGNGQQRLLLRQWPALPLTSLLIDTRAVPPSASPLVPGFLQNDSSDYGDQREITLVGYAFCKGKANIRVDYQAGYPNLIVTGEHWNIPSTAPYTVTLLGALAFVPGTDAITYVSGGAPLLRVAGNPATGQYSISSAAVVTFAAGDAGAAVLIAYQTMNFPLDLTQAVLELAALRYRSRDWIGYTSKSLAGETVSFNVKDMPPSVQMALNAYQTTFIPP